MSFPAFSYSPFLDQAKELYEINSFKCEMCHIGTKLNFYGKDFKESLKINKDINEAFIKLNNLDSDKDGVLNIDEIKNNKNPGDSFSK